MGERASFARKEGVSHESGEKVTVTSGLQKSDTHPRKEGAAEEQTRWYAEISTGRGFGVPETYKIRS